MMNAKELKIDGKILMELPPEGYEYKLVPREKSEQEKLEEWITRLEAELSDMKEPTIEELIAEGRMMSPYYRKLDELQVARQLLKEQQDADY